MAVNQEEAQINILMQFANTPTNKYDELIKTLGLSDREKFQLSNFLSSFSAYCAELSEYVYYRGGGFLGDHGHDDAMKLGEKAKKKVRKALGYTYP